jgi:hypothetical protein
MAAMAAEAIPFLYSFKWRTGKYKMEESGGRLENTA